METAVEEFILKRYEGAVSRIIRERKEDLKLPNHLLGYRRLYLKLVFRNVQDLLAVRKDLLPLALANAKKRNAVDAYAEVMQDQANGMNGMSVEMDVDKGIYIRLRPHEARDRTKTLGSTSLISGNTTLLIIFEPQSIWRFELVCGMQSPSLKDDLHSNNFRKELSVRIQ
jgi:hypothetical protein